MNTTATRISTRINGRAHRLEVENSTLLIDLLRDLGLTGVKPSCEMEVCGACTVQLDGLPVSACTTLAIELDGSSVETIEGLGVTEAELHPVQHAFLKHSAFQCGFCTPGFVMTAKALLEQNPSPSREEVVHWLEGSICRCTGYEPIVDAILDAAREAGNGRA